MAAGAPPARRPGPGFPVTPVTPGAPVTPGTTAASPGSQAARPEPDASTIGNQTPGTLNDWG